MDFSSPAFWLAVAQIIAIDIVLSGDNAVVIALACRNLPPEQRRLGIFWGVAGAIALRLTLTIFAALLLDLPWLRLVGGCLLLWIAVKLLLPEDEGGEEIAASSQLIGAVKTIVVADFIMSLDNVVGVAGAAHGNIGLLFFGLMVSIPLIVWSSQLILRAMERWPVIISLGAALLGYVAGEMMLGDHGVQQWLGQVPAWWSIVCGALGSILVLALGRWLAGRQVATADTV